MVGFRAKNPTVNRSSATIFPYRDRIARRSVTKYRSLRIYVLSSDANVTRCWRRLYLISPTAVSFGHAIRRRYRAIPTLVSVTNSASDTSVRASFCVRFSLTGDRKADRFSFWCLQQNRRRSRRTYENNTPRLYVSTAEHHISAFKLSEYLRISNETRFDVFSPILFNFVGSESRSTTRRLSRGEATCTLYARFTTHKATYLYVYITRAFVI